MRHIAIFASGSGTNAANIIKYFSTSKDIKVALVLSNNRNAYVLRRAEELGVDTVIFDRDQFYNSDKIEKVLREYSTDLIVLAGFLWLVPQGILKEYSGRIINIHPALLPAYGGKGMYGDRVHCAVIENKEKESGITIHHVNEVYDSGNIIFQAKCPIEPTDTPESLAEKVHSLEYRYYPEVIAAFVRKMKL